MVILCPFLGIASLWDLTFRRIPNYLQGVLFGAGILYNYWSYSWLGVFKYGTILLSVMLFFYGFFKLGMIGGGDVKLLGISSGFFRGREVLYFLFFAMLISAVAALIKMLKNHILTERLRYLLRYTGEAVKCIRTGARLGKVGQYITDREEKLNCSVAISGPILISALLHWGGVY
ncbi:MAG: prepilin peptidase [Lachnospiraceae bacterium]|nr:prepilin peptidase [Lachnospiraceae bacterium]